MILANNNKINRIAYGAASPAYPIGGIQQQYSCKLLNQMSTLDHLAQGSITASQNVTYDIKCWKCRTEFRVKGLHYDEECPKCGYRINNPQFPKTLHSLVHLDHMSKFLTGPIPETFGHDNIWNNSARVAQASTEVRNIHKNVSSPNTKSIQQLTELLSFTRG